MLNQFIDQIMTKTFRTKIGVERHKSSKFVDSPFIYIRHTNGHDYRTYLHDATTLLLMRHTFRNKNIIPTARV